MNCSVALDAATAIAGRGARLMSFSFALVRWVLFSVLALVCLVTLDGPVKPRRGTVGECLGAVAVYGAIVSSRGERKVFGYRFRRRVDAMMVVYALVLLSPNVP